MTTSLAARFQQAKTSVVTHDGAPVHAALALDVYDGTRVIIDVLSANPWREQLLYLHTPKAELESATGTRAKSFTIQCDNDSSAVELLVIADDKPHQAITLHIWNGWSIGAIDHAWAGNAGFQVNAESESLWTLQCSDGVGSIDFDDLHLRVELAAPDDTNDDTNDDTE